LSWQIGGLVGFWINYGVSETMAPSHRQWIIPFAIQLIPAGLLFAGVWFIVESPRWSILRGKREKGVKDLCWLRNLPAEHVYMQEEIFAIDNAIEHQRSTVGLGFWQPFKAVYNDRKVTYRFLIGGSLFLWQNATGINAINYYSPTVFKSIGITGTNTSLLTTGIFGVIKTTITLFFLFFLIEQMGRRVLLIFGALGGAVCMYYIGGYIAVAKPADHPTDNLGPGGTSAMVFFYLWTACYSPTWNPMPWILNAEMFDNNVRGLAGASAAANNWFWNFIISRFTPQMFSSMGYGVYLFFASLMICAAVYVWFIVPETKGIPLEAMDRLFEMPARRAHKTVLAELRLEDQEFRHQTVGAEKEGVEEDEVAVEHKV
jgi:sugar porter (SP) family MFS transporter